MAARIDLTEHQKAFLQAHYSKMPHRDIAARMGLSATNLREQARRLGLLGESKKPPEWTAEEFDQLRNAISAGMTNKEMQAQLFPHRGYECIKQFRRRMRRSGWKFEVHVKPEPARRAQCGPKERRPADFTPKEPPKFPKLEYTREERPIVSLDYACQWMRQQKKDWVRPADDVACWQEINTQRVHGTYPVPPFLPDRRPVHNDAHKTAPLVLPEWRVGL